MELRHLRYFLIVAEELHFGRAAERLHISQPPLSQQIKQLEEEIGVALFKRTSRHVSLTVEGETFLEAVKDILQRVDVAVERVRSVARGEEGRLKVGLTGYAIMSGYPQAIRLFRRRHPRIRLDLVESTTSGQLEALLSGQLDVGLVSWLGEPPEHLRSQLFRKEPYDLCLPEGHYLANLAVVPLHRLADIPLILFPREIHPALYDAIVAGLHEAGVVPDIAQEVEHIETGKALVAAGMGCSLHPRSASRIRRPGVVYREVSGGHLPEPELRVAWRAEGVSSALEKFLDVVWECRDDH